MELTINGTKVFKKNLEALADDNNRFIINVGGTRSSKTYSLCQLMIYHALTHPDIVISIVRKSFPALRASVMRDFIDILKELNIYNQDNHNKTEHIYRFPNGSIIEFFSVDDEQKIRGRKRHILWANEANEITYEEFHQLNYRTSFKLFFDFNPSDNQHWLYDLLLQKDSVKIHSTYKDNKYLDDTLKKQIENLINVDYEYYKIYCLGEQAVAKSTIFTHQQIFDTYPPNIEDYCWAIDFGYNHPTALVKVSKSENKVFCEEFIYQSYLTSVDLIKMMGNINISKNDAIVCDYARPEIMEDLRRAGYNVKQAYKNVKEGIDNLKSSELFLHRESVNLINEFKNYKWKTNGDKVLDEPVKIKDDGADSCRYGALYLKKNSNVGLSTSFITFNL
jgi:phage terminase large subunit